MRKEIKWIFEGKEFKGFATLEGGILALRDENGNAFETLEQEDISNGATLKDVFDEIPEDITDYQLR